MSSRKEGEKSESYNSINQVQESLRQHTQSKDVKDFKSMWITRGNSCCEQTCIADMKAKVLSSD